MKAELLGILAFLLVSSPGVVFSGDAGPTGIVKGTVTIGGKPTSDAVVSVQDVKPQTSDGKAKKAVIDQRDLKFIPRVLPVQAGTIVDFPNNDRHYHNVFSASEAKRFDLGIYAPGKSRSVTFDKPGIARILCNIHPGMEAFVVVFSHSHFSPADSRGNYQIGSIRLGRHRLEVWHPDFGARTVDFNLVREGEVLAIDVDLKKK